MTIYIEDDSVRISKEEYNNLIKARNKLEALESCGVDNWQGYSDAMEYYRKEYGNGEEDE